MTLDMRVELLAEDVSNALDPQACAAAIREGVKVWRFLPSCAEIMDAAAPFLADRAADNRQRRMIAEDAERRRALPAPAYLDQADRESALAEMREAMRRAAEKDAIPVPSPLPKGRMTWNDEDMAMAFPNMPHAPIPLGNGTGPSEELKAFAQRLGSRT